jgi:hypothetical protein
VDGGAVIPGESSGEVAGAVIDGEVVDRLVAPGDSVGEVVVGVVIVGVVGWVSVRLGLIG